MQCQKCMKAAVVHLTELVTADTGEKRVVEVHLCIEHAVEGGLIAAGSIPKAPVSNVESALFKAPDLTSQLPLEQEFTNEFEKDSVEESTAIVPAAPVGGLSIRKDAGQRAIEQPTCPVCGITWLQFKQSGLMGCPHDYVAFAAKIGPLVQRAQENFSQHAGKVPNKIRHLEHGRTVTLVRLQRELQQALDGENYMQAARVRDQLKKLNLSQG